MTRLQARCEHTVRLAGPVRLALSAKGGLIEGDLPPYEAFPIGGTNSVRGYDEGEVGSGRQYVVASAEATLPLVAPVGGAVFFDYGSDLDTGHTVLGDPAGTRGSWRGSWIGSATGWAAARCSACGWVSRVRPNWRPSRCGRVRPR